MVCRFYRFYLLFPHAAFLYHSRLFLRSLYPSDRLSAVCVEQVPAPDDSLFYSLVGYCGNQGGHRPCDAGRPSSDTRCAVSCVLFARGRLFPVVRVCAVSHVLPCTSLQERRKAHYPLDNGVGVVLLGHGATELLYQAVVLSFGLLRVGHVGGSVGRFTAGDEAVSAVMGSDYDKFFVRLWPRAVRGAGYTPFIIVGYYRQLYGTFGFGLAFSSVRTSVSVAESGRGDVDDYLPFSHLDYGGRKSDFNTYIVGWKYNRVCALCVIYNRSGNCRPHLSVQVGVGKKQVYRSDI